jgi:hypothetical protein
MIKEEGQSVTDVSQKIGVHIKTFCRVRHSALQQRGGYRNMLSLITAQVLFDVPVKQAGDQNKAVPPRLSATACHAT